MYHYLKAPLVGCSALVALAAGPATAADLTISDAKIAGGKLVISGTTSANSWVRLDGQPEAAFNVKSGADGIFAFGVLYHPGDCIVDIQRLVTPTKLGSPVSALVANCGPAGVTPRGAWKQTSQYTTNDLVTHEGSTWRARRVNANTEPVAGAVWEQFAAAGVPQPSTGDDGSDVGPAVAPTGPAGGALTGTYPNPQLANLVVTTPKLANAAVTAQKIANGTITGVQIAPNAIGFGRIANNAIRSIKILDGSVASVDIEDGGISNDDLALNVVTSNRIADGAVTQADLANDSVGAAQIQTDAVQASEVQDNAIDSGEIVDNSLFSQDLGAGSVRGSELGTITRRSATSGVIPGNGTNNVGVQCLAGERVLAGGNDASSAANVVIVASRNDGANGWRVFARNLAAGNQTVTVHAYCLQAS